MQSSAFVDKALAVFKGETYFSKVRELQLVDKERYQRVMKFVEHFLSMGDGFKTDVEEMSMLAAISTVTFYNMNTLPINVLIDMKFYSENLFRILTLLYTENPDKFIPFTECSDALKTDDIYKDIKSLNAETDHPQFALMKGRLTYHLFITIIENNNSAEYIMQV
jgi:hypothetical protein